MYYLMVITVSSHHNYTLLHKSTIFLKDIYTNSGVEPGGGGSAPNPHWYIYIVIAGADPGFQVRGAHLKKLRRA
jgi:hypothetical protein